MSEQMREEFEATYFYKYGFKPQSWDCNCAAYICAHENGAWWAWQASRAALCVELPEDWEPVSEKDECAREMRNDCRDAIHAAGLKRNS
jgi:hypothetical protein